MRRCREEARELQLSPAGAIRLYGMVRRHPRPAVEQPTDAVETIRRDLATPFRENEGRVEHEGKDPPRGG